MVNNSININKTNNYMYLSSTIIEYINDHVQLGFNHVCIF